MPPRNRPHIVIPGRPGVEPHTPRPRRIDATRPPQVADRAGHARALADALRLTATEARRRRAQGRVTVRGAKEGFYVEFDSVPGVRLKTESLEHRGMGIELVSVSETGTTEATQQHAVVFVPDGKVGHFEKRFGEYATANTRDGRPRHADLVNAIAGLRAATLRALWTDDADLFPQDGEEVWWEVWLRRREGEELRSLARFAEVSGIELGAQQLGFPDRVVTLVRATSQQLTGSIEVLDSIAELRRAKETPAFFVGLPPADQWEWGNDLRGRTQEPGPDAPAVCVLDTGVNRAHPLLAASLTEADLHTCVATWGTADHLGHGTEMPGLAQYGDMTDRLAAVGPVRLVHRLESVKILPPLGGNPPELYGTRTAEAASRVEIQAPERRRCFSLAITHPTGRDRGRPTSWSAAVDALAAGRSFVPVNSGLEYTDPRGAGHPRLYLISAGNVHSIDPALDHIAASDAEPVQDPGQAWNAVTVGAHTDLGVVRDPTHPGWRAQWPLRASCRPTARRHWRSIGSGP
jgi:hypothetical protein